MLFKFDERYIINIKLLIYNLTTYFGGDCAGFCLSNWRNLAKGDTGFDVVFDEIVLDDVVDDDDTINAFFI